MIVRKKKNWVLNNEMRMIDGERIMEKEREKEKKVKSMTRVVAGTTSSYLVAHRTYQQSLGPTLMRKREKKGRLPAYEGLSGRELIISRFPSKPGSPRIVIIPFLWSPLSWTPRTRPILFLARLVLNPAMLANQIHIPSPVGATSGRQKYEMIVTSYEG
jgi:hypothetical protein